ncbi:hypothetical protein SDC9_184731 [bioreactor metagenome]|uniref:Uncharacterized protein n=1 Tax=bioreactor metagenome TaxID=1076179 RepID=A0A645HDU8_9ZZZZ
MARKIQPTVGKTSFLPVFTDHRAVGDAFLQDFIKSPGNRICRFSRAQYEDSFVLFQIKTVSSHGQYIPVYADQFFGYDIWIGLHNRMIDNIQGDFPQFAVPVRDQICSVFYIIHLNHRISS